MTQQRAWTLIAILAGVAFAFQLAMPVDLSDRPRTSFDSAPRGHAGLFDLLARFGATPGRWLSGLEMPPNDATVWWIAPGGACEPAGMAAPWPPVDAANVGSEEAAPAEAPRSRAPFRFVVLPWIEAGGTAVVWLAQPPDPETPSDDADEDAGGSELLEVGFARDRSREAEPASRHAARRDEGEERDADRLRRDWREDFAELRRSLREGEPQSCESIGGFRLPSRRIAGLEGGEPPAEGRYSPVAYSVGRAPAPGEDFDYGATRTLPGPTLAVFESSGGGSPEAGRGWRPVWIEADDRLPLALERSVGAGRLVVFADARIVSNDRLARADSAPFVFDQVDDYGGPWIDEHAHGLVEETGTVRYLARSPAWAAGVGLLVLGGLVAWRGRVWPVREVAEVDPDAPTLATFVDSLARLYARSRDRERVFERYRALSLDRVRRALGLSPGSSSDQIVARLRSHRSEHAGAASGAEAAAIATLLTQGRSIESREDLERNVARIDALIQTLRAAGRPGVGPRNAESSSRPTSR